jgi:predicted DNA-binding antitoxin AbrB/MazE fold protein
MIVMRTIRAVFRHGSFRPLEPVELPEDTPVTVAVVDSDDLSAEAIAELARNGNAFDFLNDPREDIYHESDGEAV